MNTKLDALERPEPLGNRVYTMLREYLRNGQIPRGEPLQEAVLAEQLGVSRTPVREALLRLTSEGLVTTDGQGVTGTVLQPGDVEEIYTLRLLLEPEAVRRVANTGHDAGQLAGLTAALDGMVRADAAADTAAFIDANVRFHSTWMDLLPQRRLVRAIELYADHVHHLRILTLQEGVTMFEKAFIPYGAYWSTPFVRWQGAFAHLHAIEFAAHVAKRELSRRSIAPEAVDHGVLGTTNPQHHSFYGLPWLAGLAGLGHVGGPTVSQACATGVRALLTAALEIGAGNAETVLVVCADRNSNGAHIYYPNPRGPGGTGAHEDWVLDNFACDPLGNHSMLRTAENVAARHRISTGEQHEMVLRREAQYQNALADDAAFLRRFMTLPFDVPDAAFRKTTTQLGGDDGVTRSTPQGLAALRPVLEGGTVTYGGQTHPADANAGILVTSAGRARELSRNRSIAVRLRGFGQSRAALAYMPEAPAPAARRALEQAGLGVADIHAFKTHNPFALNDILFARELGIDVGRINNFGSSLVWGHPVAPMGTRAIIELIEELALRGGGRGLFSGCAAGDTAMAVVLEVGDA